MDSSNKISNFNEMFSLNITNTLPPLNKRKEFLHTSVLWWSISTVQIQRVSLKVHGRYSTRPKTSSLYIGLFPYTRCMSNKICNCFSARHQGKMSPYEKKMKFFCHKIKGSSKRNLGEIHRRHHGNVKW